MRKKVGTLLQIIVVLTMLVATGCSSLGPKILPKDQVKVKFSGLFIRPFDDLPTTWVTVELKNNSEKIFVERKTRVVDITNDINLYGEEVGYVGSEFCSNSEVAWPLDLEALEPGKIGYVSVNVGDPKGSTIEMTISLKSTGNYTAMESVNINLEGVVPVSQMPDEK